MLAGVVLGSALWGSVLVYVFFIGGLVVCGMKGRWGYLMWGIFTIGLVSTVGALRLAKPGSYWARRYYAEPKMAKSRRRFSAKKSDDASEAADEKPAPGEPPVDEEPLRGTPLQALTRAEMEVVLKAEGLYETLHASRSASPSELRIAYHERCKAVHPDLHDGSPSANGEMSRIIEAWEVLHSETMRAAYDWLQRERSTVQ